MQAIPVNTTNIEEVPEVVYSDVVPSMTQADRAEINTLISESEIRMKGRRWPEWLKESIVLVIILGGCGFILHSYIPAQIGSQTSSMASEISGLSASVKSLQQDVSDVKKDIKDALNRALDRAFQAIPHVRSEGKKKEQAGALRLGNEAIQIANNLRIKLDSDVVVNYGRRAIVAASDIPELREAAWIGVGLAMAQRSFINSDFEPPLAETPDRDLISEFNRLGPVEGTVRWRGAWVSPNQGASMRRIGNPDPNANAPAVPRYLLIEHATADIDGFILRGIVFRDSRIIYKGAQLDMSDTFFVRCTFEIPLTLDGHQFSESLLASVPANFKSSSVSE